VSDYQRNLGGKTALNLLTPDFRLLTSGLGLLLALALGAAVAMALKGAPQKAALGCLAVGGALGAAVWFLMKLPVVMPLRVALIASFWFRLETELLAVAKAGHDLPFGLNVSLKLILAVMLAAAFAYARLRGEGGGRVWPPAFKFAAGGLWLCGALSAVYGAGGLAGLYALWGLAGVMLICFVVAAHFGTVEALRQAVVCIAVAIALNGVLGVLQYLELFGGWQTLGATVGETQMTIPGSDISRASGLLEMSNSFGWYLASFLPVVIAPPLMAKDALKGWERLLCVGGFLLGAVALVLTFSRGSWAAFAVTVPLLVAFVLGALPPLQRRRMLLRLAGVLIVLAALGAPLLGVAVMRLTEDDQGAAESRVSLMEVAGEMIRANPLLGVGLGGYEAEMRRYDETADFISEHFPYPVHNLFLHVAAEAGIPALACLLLLTAVALGCGWRAWRDETGHALTRALAAGLMFGTLAFLLTGLKEPSTLDAGQIRVLFLLCGLLVAVERAGRRAGGAA
jgi:O-antigen ligase